MRDNKRLEPKINLCRSRERKSDHRERETETERFSSSAALRLTNTDSAMRAAQVPLRE